VEEQPLAERLARIEQRLCQLEGHLGIDQPMPVAPPPQIIPPPQVFQPLPPEPVTPAIAELRPVMPAAAELRPVMPSYFTPAALPRMAMPAETLETKVGLKVAGWVGAIIVVIGAALGIKYGYDQGWFGALPPAARLGLMSLGGFALIGAGEIVYRRIGAVASAGVFGAGVATLFVVSFAGYRYFELYERQAAFMFMAAVTLIGAGVSIRANLVSIAVLSIVGANVAPFVLYEDAPNVVALLTYLLMLQFVAVGLAWWGRDPKWWTLRVLSFVMICLWMATPVIAGGELDATDRRTVLIFSILYAALFHGELVLCSLQAPKRAGTRVPEFAVPVPLGGREFLGVPREIWATFSLFVTAGLTIAILMLLQDRSPYERGTWTIGLAVCCAATGIGLMQFANGRTAADSLAISYRIQAAALVVVAVPVTLSGMWIMLAWAVLALAFAVVGASLNLNLSRAAAVVVWILAGGHLAMWTIVSGPMATPKQIWLDAMGQPIPAYLVLAAVMAVVGHAIGVIIREDWSSRVSTEPARPVPVAPEDHEPLSLDYASPDNTTDGPSANAGFQALATLTDFMAIAAFHLAAFTVLPPLGLTFTMLCYGWVLVGLGHVARSSELLPAGVSLIALAAGKWLAYDTFALRLPPRTYPIYPGFFNPSAGVGAALLVSVICLRRLPLRVVSQMRGAWTEQQRLIRAVCGFGAVLIVLWLATLEIDRHFDVRSAAASSDSAARDFVRAKMVGVSILWSVYAIGCIIAGFAARIAGLRHFGLALFALTVVKVMFVDLSDVGRGYRILSFLGLGLLLLGTSVLYGKLSPRLLQEDAKLGDREPAAE
jgi:uncharacterized membrane protein